jgi:hypothetical protein
VRALPHEVASTKGISKITLSEAVKNVFIEDVASQGEKLNISRDICDF